MQNWTKTSNQLPPDNAIVSTMDSSGSVQDLKRKGNLWWFTDGSMYVYYTPQFWQAK